MYGQNINALNFYITTNASMGTVIWTMKGTQGQRRGIFFLCTVKGLNAVKPGERGHFQGTYPNCPLQTGVLYTEDGLTKPTKPKLYFPP
jgi:hypothetical protein